MRSYLPATLAGPVTRTAYDLHVDIGCEISGTQKILQYLQHTYNILQNLIELVVTKLGISKTVLYQFQSHSKGSQKWLWSSKVTPTLPVAVWPVPLRWGGQPSLWVLGTSRYLLAATNRCTCFLRLTSPWICTSCRVQINLHKYYPSNVTYVHRSLWKTHVYLYMNVGRHK